MAEAVPAIALTGIARTFTLGDVEVKALRGVDLTVRQGEFLAIMGASGSGKSTLMNILGCLDRPMAGHYRLDGLDVADMSEPALASVRCGRIGFVFQNYNLLARTSALENVMLPLLYGGGAGLSQAARRDRGVAMLTELGLAERMDNTPNQLSGGQQQRVALARALINHPVILLADEPTGNLDTRTSHEIMDVIRKLNREQGVTVIVVTHEPDIAAYADRTIVMRDGLIESDSPNPPDTAAGPEPPGPAVPPPAPGPIDLKPRGLTTAFILMITLAAAEALARNRMRSALTALGVFIGVAALVAMVAVGEGASQAVAKQLEGLGTNMVVVQPGAVTAGGARSGFGGASTLTKSDAEAIAKEDPAVLRDSYFTRQTGQVQFGGQNWSTSIQGVTPSQIDIQNWTTSEGRPLSEEDNATAAKVCMLGDTVVRSLFPEGGAVVGATIMVKGVALRVVGLLGARGQTGYGQDQDDVVLIPFSTAEQKVLGVASPTAVQSALSTLYPVPANVFGIAPRMTGRVNSIFIQATSAEQVPAAIDQATATLVRRHNIQPGRDNDFSVRNLSQIAEAQSSSSRVMSVLLAAVASMSLLVGGIGIMNILLVSVTERTREIGIRMAIGARRLQVLLQFLVEAILLSLSGGLAGIVFGVVAAEAIGLFAGWPIVLSPASMVGGLLFSAVVGVFFGLYPARMAANLDPIAALHYE